MSLPDEPRPKKSDLPRSTVHRREVRCLGPGMPEHTFMSDNPAYHRICAKCKKALNNLTVSGAEMHAVRTVDGGRK